MVLLAGADVDKLKAGSVQLLRTVHCGDGCELKMTVQAVPKLGRSRHTYLVLHAYQPSCGRPGFREWVLSGGMKQQEQAMAGRAEMELELNTSAPLPAVARSLSKISRR